METQRPDIADIATDFFTSLHFFTTVVGVMIAIICSLILFTDVKAPQAQASLFKPAKTISVVSHAVVKMTEVSVSSVLSQGK